MIFLHSLNSGSKHQVPGLRFCRTVRPGACLDQLDSLILAQISHCDWLKTTMAIAVQRISPCKPAESGNLPRASFGMVSALIPCPVFIKITFYPPDAPCQSRGMFKYSCSEEP